MPIKINSAAIFRNWRGSSLPGRVIVWNWVGANNGSKDRGHKGQGELHFCEREFVLGNVEDGSVRMKIPRCR
jgi:hypothetical protein